MSNLSIAAGSVKGLRPEDQNKLTDLVSVLNDHQAKNGEKSKYYEGHVPLSDVNLGIALPKELMGLEIGCEWGAKCVDVLASRSMFDGFVGTDGNDATAMMEIVERNNLIFEYMKACRDELKFGCTFATLSADDEQHCRIRFHSPQTASALWDGAKGRIDCGLAIIDTERDDTNKMWMPSLLNMYTETDLIEIQKIRGIWFATYHPHRMGRPLMEPMIWNSTSKKPFGRSRIKEPVRRLIQGYVRTVANATIGLEFATSPQKYILGLTDDQYDVVISDKFKQYVGSILAATTNQDTGENPTVGQFQQGTIEPHVSMIRLLATQFSAATGLSVTDTGVINDANPTSSDAILAQSQTLILLAEQLNAGNASALKTIALMAEAIEANKSFDELDESEKDIIAHFKNPAMPSVAVTADAALKIASARQNFAGTDTFLEMIGFDQADIRRIKSQEQRVRGQNILSEELRDEDNE